MPYHPDIAAVGPALELTLDYPERTLRCSGTLDGRARRHLVEAVGELLVGGPPGITIDVAQLTVADVDGANALAHVQRLVREAGARLRWQGLDSDQFRGILPLRYRARRPRRPSPEWSAERDALRLARLRHPSAMPPPA